MKQLLTLGLLLIMFSCGKEKVLQLPEISHSEITEIYDVSPAYLFYDETQKDSVELNRKNLISTTNWLVNVDKRLTLKQAIPHIKYLQNKKQNSSHKKKSAKNYFTCNDTSRKNLGFIEFTDVVFESDFKNETLPDLKADSYFGLVEFNSFEKIEMTVIYGEHMETLNLNFDDLLSYIRESKALTLKLSFNSNISFQDYISVKSKILSIDSVSLQLFNHELIFN
ncbi:hypothetical protein [Flavivirga jejuensis]|uniref:Lipoprotein n=1 Tax=Flavivirga jejuensis TaxID=870487 RepID=A0ABT8WLQ4_9FLAO|nr:hypothetical protein [Flavivirga jejuensis]MDO5974087.1 hypothetical protein [Flavivirga jejuensis]